MTTTDAKTQHAIDFSFMTAAHAAFRRDLRWLTAAATAGTAGTPEVQAGWENFKTQLLIHHGVEDANLWPNLRRSAAHQPGELALLDEMEAEHAHLDPKLSAVDLALADQTPDLAEHVRNLAGALGEHLAHEERGVLPIIGVTDWKAFRAAMRSSLGVKGIALCVPWMLDEMPPTDRHRFLAGFPAPLRAVNRLVWEPRYRQLNLWGV